MASFIISGSRGTDDPTMATLPFMAAKTAKEQGHVARQIGGGDLVAGASIKGMPDYIKAVAEKEKNIAF